MSLHKLLLQRTPIAPANIIRWVRATTKRKHLVILGVLGVCFFFLYAWPSINMPTRFISPDETANYFFTSLFARETALQSRSMLSERYGAVVAPRSIAVIGGALVPGSFLGLQVLDGETAKIFGTWSILFTPIVVAVLAVLYFYVLLCRAFSQRIAFLSSLLLYVHPAFWYFSSRPMFHNSLFLSLLIIGAYCLVRMAETKRIHDAAFAGLFLSCALVTRSSEVVWVAPLVAAAFLAIRKYIRLRQVGVFVGIVTLVGAAILFLNQSTYGSPSASGYTITTETSPDTATTVTKTHAPLGRLLLPFGIHWDRIAKSVSQYFFEYIPLYGILFLIGYVLCIRALLKKHLARSRLWFFFVGTGIMIWLFLAYGSYQFREFPDPNRLIPSNSFLRYWLPAYVVSLPFCSMAILAIGGFFRSKAIARSVSFAMIILLVVVSCRSVILDPLLGVAQVRKTVRAMASTSNLVNAKTEENAVVIAGYSEKMFFPDRSVIVQLPADDEERNTLLQRLTAVAPVYIYRNVAEPISSKNYAQLAASSWALEPRAADGDNTLYAVHQQHSPLNNP